MRNLVDINLVIVVSGIDIEVKTFLEREEAEKKFLEAAKDAGYEIANEKNYSIADDGYYQGGCSTVFLYSADVNAEKMKKKIQELAEKKIKEMKEV